MVNWCYNTNRLTWLIGQIFAPFIAVYPLGGDDSPKHNFFAYTMFGLMTASLLFFAIRACIMCKKKTDHQCWCAALATTIATGFIGMTGVYAFKGLMNTIFLPSPDCIRESPETENDPFFPGVCTSDKTSLSADKLCVIMNANYRSVATTCDVDIKGLTDAEAEDECGNTFVKDRQCQLLKLPKVNGKQTKQTLLKKPIGVCHNIDPDFRGPSDPCEGGLAVGPCREDGSNVFLSPKEFEDNCQAITDNKENDAECAFISPKHYEDNWYHWCNYQAVTLAVFFLFGIAISLQVCCRKKKPSLPVLAPGDVPAGI